MEKKKGKKLWIVGKVVKVLKSGIVWDFGGVFDSKRKAISRCKDETYFIGPAELNKILPEGTMEWPGCDYPWPPF